MIETIRDDETTRDDRVDATASATDNGPATPATASAVEVAGLREVLDQVHGQLGDIDRRLTALEAQKFDPPGDSVLDFLSYARRDGDGAYVTDEAVLRGAGCVGVTLTENSSESDLVFGRAGSFGPLSAEQQERFCSRDFPILELTDEQRARLLALHESAAICGVEATEHMPKKQDTVGPFLSCIEREMQARGLQI